MRPYPENAHDWEQDTLVKPGAKRHRLVKYLEEGPWRKNILKIKRIESDPEHGSGWAMWQSPPPDDWKPDPSDY